MNIQKRD